MGLKAPSGSCREGCRGRPFCVRGYDQNARSAGLSVRQSEQDGIRWRAELIHRNICGYLNFCIWAPCKESDVGLQCLLHPRKRQLPLFSFQVHWALNSGPAGFPHFVYQTVETERGKMIFSKFKKWRSPASVLCALPQQVHSCVLGCLFVTLGRAHLAGCTEPPHMR